MTSDSQSLRAKLLAKIDTKKEDHLDLLFSIKIASLQLKMNGLTNKLIHDIFLARNVCLEIGNHSPSSIFVLKFLLFFMKM